MKKHKKLEISILYYKGILQKKIITEFREDYNMNLTELASLIEKVNNITKDYCKHFNISQVRHGNIKENEE